MESSSNSNSAWRAVDAGVNSKYLHANPQVPRVLTALHSVVNAVLMASWSAGFGVDFETAGG